MSPHDPIDLTARLQSALGKRYVVRRELGSGGMAIVFLADDLKLNRPVAVKLLRPEYSAAVGADRFHREVALAASLQHPHILAVHDSGQCGDFLYYVMPFVEGESLRERLTRTGRLGAEDAVRIAKGVAQALDYAHRRGIVHRDVKPENILLSEGEAVVADFGIAKAVSAAEDAGLTQAGTAIGTPAYMSPEQIAGEAEVDGRSDIFSLGCVLYEMLCGEPAFTGPTAQAIMAKRFTSTTPSIRTHPSAPSVPDPVVAVISRAMAKAPEDRFQTGAELVAALASNTATTAPGAAHSIAVLAFANMSADPENEYISDGISEEIINALAQLPGLRVTARTSAFAFKGKHEDIRVIGDRLNVGTILEGSVRRSGVRLRVTAQLINVADGYHLWSETYDRELHDVFAIQDDIARAIVDTLKVKLFRSPDEALVKKPTESLEAYSLYLQGRYHWAKRNEAAVKKGIGFFEQAIAKDPGYARAHVGLADSYNILGFYDLRPPREAFPRAHAAARRALELDESLGEAHAAEAYAKLYFDWDWKGAEEGIQRAIALSPRYATAYQYYGNVLAARGRFPESVAMMKRGAEVDPLAMILVAAVGIAYYFSRDFDQALRHYNSALDLDENFLISHWWLSMTYAEMGRLDESTASAQRAVAISDRNPTMLAALARAHALSGRDAEARQLLSELTEIGKQRFVSSYETAHIHSALGERDAALALLANALEERSHSMVFLAVDPKLDPFKGDARFTRLLAEVGV